MTIDSKPERAPASSTVAGVAPRTIGDLIVEMLREGGVNALFGVPGGQTMPLYRAAARQGLRHVLMRDERSAACAADAYARITGRVGVCDATMGPGATNLVSGLAEAFASSIPVLAVIADIRTTFEHRRGHSNASQAVDQARVLGPVVKWFGRVPSTESAPGVIEHALRLATSGRPGPVCVEVPEDVFLEATDGCLPYAREMLEWPRFRFVPDDAAIRNAAAVLRSAARPILLAGGGAVASDSGAELLELCERVGMPVVTTLNGKGAISERHDRSLGTVGAFGSSVASAALRDADAVLVAGSKLSQLSTFGWKIPSVHQRVVQIDIDGGEIGRGCPVEVGLMGDVRETCRKLLDALGDEPAGRPWVTRLDFPDARLPVVTDGVHPGDVVAEIAELLRPDDVLVCDASLASGWGSIYFNVKAAGRRFLAPRGLGGIGWAAGGAIGASLGCGDDRRVVAIVGDGAWGYGLSEVETAVRENLPIVYVVLNNRGFGWVVHLERRVESGSDARLGDIDFALVARAMGADAFTVGSTGDLRPALAAALASDRPAVVEVKSSLDASPLISFGDLPPTFVG